MACRELTLGKGPIGICPVGIDDISRQAAAKCVLVVAGPLATTECGSDQLCAGMKAGVDGAVHAILVVWVEMDQDELNSFLVIDAENIFNSCSRVNMLWNVWHLWPAGARFTFNCYSFATLLIYRNHTGEAV